MSVLVLVGMVAARPITIVLTPGFGRRREARPHGRPGPDHVPRRSGCWSCRRGAWRSSTPTGASSSPTWRPVLWNVAQIVVVAVVAIGGATPAQPRQRAARGASVVGGLAQLLVQLPTVRSLVPELRLSLDRTRDGVRDAAQPARPGGVRPRRRPDLGLPRPRAGQPPRHRRRRRRHLRPGAVPAAGLAVRHEHRRLRAARALPHAARAAGRPGPPGRGGPAAGRLLRRPHGRRLRRARRAARRPPCSSGASSTRRDTRLVWLVLAAYSLGLLATTGIAGCCRTPSTPSTTPGRRPASPWCGSWSPAPWRWR